MFAVRKLYYSVIKIISDTEQIKNFNGFALYDKQVIETLKKIDDPDPYLRGLIASLAVFPGLKLNMFKLSARKVRAQITFFDYTMWPCWVLLIIPSCPCV